MPIPKHLGKLSLCSEDQRKKSSPCQEAAEHMTGWGPTQTLEDEEQVRAHWELERDIILVQGQGRRRGVKSKGRYQFGETGTNTSLGWFWMGPCPRIFTSPPWNSCVSKA